MSADRKTDAAAATATATAAGAATTTTALLFACSGFRFAKIVFGSNPSKGRVKICGQQASEAQETMVSWKDSSFSFAPWS